METLREAGFIRAAPNIRRIDFEDSMPGLLNEITSESALRHSNEHIGYRRSEAPRILVVDDDRLSRELVKDALAGLPYRILEAEDGKDALEVLQSESPDLMLVDIQMPHLDGLQLLSKIREDDRFTSVPVIAITAYAMAGDDAWALEEGFDRYLSKPISVRRLRATVGELLQSDGNGRTDSAT